MKWYKLLKKWGNHPVGEKIQLSDDDAKSLLETGFAEECKDAEDPTQKTIAEAVGQFKAQLVDAVKDITKGVVDELNAGGKKGDKPDVTGGRDRSQDDPNGVHKSLGAFAKAVQQFNTGKGMSDGLKGYVEAANKAAQGMNEAVGEEGGILVPDEISATIWKRATTTNDLLGRVNMIPIKGNSYTLLQEAGDTRAAGVRNAGVRGYWVEEAGQSDKSSPKFKRQILRLKKLGVLVYATDEQLEDSPMSLEAFLTQKAGDEVGFMTGDALINGNGVGQPLGVLKSACLISVAKESGQAADTIVAENIIKAFSRLYAPSRGNAVININQDCEPQLMTLTLAAGTSALPLMWPAGGFGGAPSSTILGRPVIPTEWNPTLGDAGDVLMADWSQYMAISKGGIKSAVSMHLRFDYDETAFRFTYRLDGQPAWAAALTPYKGTGNTQSPFVAIAAR